MRSVCRFFLFNHLSCNTWFVSDVNVSIVFKFDNTGDITPPTGIRQAMEMQAEVERRKRAQILESEGKKQAQILESEGKKTAQVLESEGDDFTTFFIFLA
jgi:hypothetical protein